MAGGGFSRHMSDTIRNNKNLLRKKSMFKKERVFLSLQKEDLEPTLGFIEEKKVSNYELSKIREKIIKQTKEDNLITFISISFVCIIIISIAIFDYQKSIKKTQQKNQSLYDNYIVENINEYTFLVEDGNKWVEKGHLKNAVYRYEQAVKLFPNEFDANYRLALAYSYACKSNYFYCEKGLKLTNRLINSFPERKNLLELKIKFENINNYKLNNTK